MKVLVCGDRRWDDAATLWSVLDEMHNETPIKWIVEGGAAGADKMAGEWALKRQVNYVVYPAKWKKHGKAAGPIRNKEMLDWEAPDYVLAFHNRFEESKGTRNMIRQAGAAGIPFRHITSNTERSGNANNGR